MDQNISNQIEALLFYEATPVKITRIAEIMNLTTEEIEESLNTLESNLNNRGINLSRKDDEVTLATSKESSELIQKLRKEELTKDLSKAALETLSIIIYRGPIKRSEIDYIRGVNSQAILRILLVRGLIDKVVNPKDERGFLYKPSFDLLNHLGLNNIKEMPEFTQVNEDIDNFINAETENEE